MFDATTIKTEFATLAGLRQNNHPDFGLLSPSLLYDGTNTLIQHALINAENLDMCARNYGKYVFTSYGPVTPYAVGDRVTDSAINYECIQAGTGFTPASNPLYWKVLNLLDLFLQDVFANAAEDVVNEVFNKKRLNGQTKTLLASHELYSGAGNMNDLIINEGALVGLQIKLLQNQNIRTVINRIGLQLSATQAEVKLYLFHSSQSEKLATITFAQTKAISFEWHTVNTVLNYDSAGHEPGGAFFLMYAQDELTGQAIKKKHSFHVPPCGWCDAYNVDSFNRYSRYLQINSIRVTAANRSSTGAGLNLWDIEKTEFTSDNNWGLNLALTVRCDLTDFLVREKDSFKYAFRDTVTKKLLEVMANSTRVNGTEAKVPTLARNELMATYAGGMGFMKQYEEQMKAVDIEIADLDETCMPCAKKGGIRYGTHTLAR